MILSTQDLAFVANKLQVPLIIGDILNKRASLDAEVEYGLHEVLSDFQPDSALLAIALSAKAITTTLTHASPSLRVLEMECDRVIYDYGMIWARNAQNKAVNTDQIYDVLVHTTDDLESIAELLKLCMDSLGQTHKVAAQLCKILQVQASTQAMVADAFMIAAEEKVQEELAPVIASSAFSSAAMADNVIIFPGSHTTH